ncbi:hypothetical protein Bca101_070831 [Brassica carinata]
MQGSYAFQSQLWSYQLNQLPIEPSSRQDNVTSSSLQDPTSRKQPSGELEAHIDAGKAMSLTPPVVGLKDAEPSLRLGVEVKPQARRRKTLKLELSANHISRKGSNLSGTSTRRRATDLSFAKVKSAIVIFTGELNAFVEISHGGNNTENRVFLEKIIKRPPWFAGKLVPLKAVGLGSESDTPEPSELSASGVGGCFIGGVHSTFIAGMETTAFHRSILVGLMESFNAFINPPFNGTPTADVVSLLWGYNSENPLCVGLYNSEACKGEEWKGLLKQSLALLKLMKNPRSSRFSQFVNDVLLYRFLDDNDAEIQMSVLEFLVLSNDYLLPHRHRLENLIKPKKLREELTTWNFSKDIEEAHRSHFVSLVIRILMPKVTSLKNSASAEAVLGVISQLDVNELSLFFALLMKPLNIISDEAADLFWSSGESSLDYFQKSKFSKYINVDALSTLSWKMKSGFLHVIQHILKVFDVFHVRPFLDFLMGCVVRLLVNNAPTIDEESNNIDREIVSTNHDQAGSAPKQFKELRSLCLKIIALALKKYEDCELGSEFWDLFFSAVNPLIKSFKQEGSSSEKPSSLFTCFLSMSKSSNLVTFLCREESLVPDIFSIPTVTTASEAIKSSALSFIKNLLSLEKDMEDDDHKNKGFLNPYIDALVDNLHSLFRGDILRRKSFKYHGEREIKILKLLSKHIRDESHVMKYLNILLSFLDKRVNCSDIHSEALLAIQDITSLLGGDNRVAKCVSDMNATSPMEVDDLDYETIMDAYAKIDVDFLNESSEQHMMIILSQTSLLCQEASAHSDIGKEVSKSVASWIGDRVLWIMNKFILKHIGDAVNNGISSGKWEILLIRKMVMSLPDSGNLAAFRPLCSENDDLDFFKNVFNIQAHRRAKAINNFAKEIKDSSLPEGVVRKLLVSIFFNMLLDGQERKGQDSKGRVKKGQNSKDENVRDACEEALASLSAHMSWTSYYALLNRCFREMKQHTDKSKRLLNLVCLILDKFHFAKGGEAHEEIRGCLEKTLYPKITKLFDSESDGVNFNAYVAAVKSTREGARKALAACLKELGLENYLQLVVKKLVSLLTKGSEVHVLDLLDVVEADILGDVDEQKEDKKDSIRRRKKKKETIKHKSLDSLRLIAENVTFRSHALTLLSPVSNPSVDQGDLFCFIYHRVDDNKSGLRGQKSSQPSKKKRKSRRIQDTSGAKSCPYLITVFALDLLHNRLNRIQPNNTNEELVSKLDPFVKLLVVCLSSVYEEDVVSSSTKCFTALLRLQLPSFKSEAREVKTKVLAIAQSAVSSSSTLVQSCLKLLTALVSNDNFKLSSEELKMLIQFRMFSDLESDSSVASLSLLKAIVRKKLKVPKIYDIVDQKNLSYEHSTGREAVLDVLQKLIHKFPDPSPGKQSKPSLGHQSVVGQQSQNLFIELALHLERENDQKLLAKICDVMKLLIGCMTNYKSSLKLSLGWYKQENSRVRGAKVLGLFIEAEKKFPEKKCSILLKEAKTILESAVKLQNTVDEGSIPLWKEAYYSLVMIEKMLKQFPHLCFHEDSQEDFKDVWTMVQVYGSLGKPSSLFMVAASLCFQLKLKVDRNRVVNKNNDTTEEDYLRENIVFAVTGLHSMIGQTDDEYWSSLDSDEQGKFMEAFLVFDSGKARIVFNVYKEFASNLNQEECRLYAFRILLPLYKVCQGFTGKAITDELEQLAEEVRDSIRDRSLGVQIFVKVYSEIKKRLEVKRREEKEMAVVNPERNAKRKLKVASKNKANKKRRIMRSKMDRYGHALELP